jgi:glycosyltransferase involved in cell wall biosynthesis
MLRELEARVIALGLEDQIRLHGVYSNHDLSDILGATDLVVLPSIYEGLPLVLVEAMRRGIPVVATSAGGTAELGEDNPDVVITEGTEWKEFEVGMALMVQRLRAGQIDSSRLSTWTEMRYGFQAVAERWRKALLVPQEFFA